MYKKMLGTKSMYTLDIKLLQDTLTLFILATNTDEKPKAMLVGRLNGDSSLGMPPYNLSSLVTSHV